MTAALGGDGRLAVWAACGATRDEARELLEYAKSPLHSLLPGPPPEAPPEPACVAAWQRYVIALSRVPRPTALQLSQLANGIAALDALTRGSAPAPAPTPALPMNPR